MGKSTLIVESYPSFNANHKKYKKQTKTRSAAKLAKIAMFNAAQDKANLKAQRRLAQKTIDKSRNLKRKLKATEAGLMDPEEGIQSNQREMTLLDELQTRAMMEVLNQIQEAITRERLARSRRRRDVVHLLLDLLAKQPQEPAVQQRERLARDQEIEEIDYW